jgi:hypothetical protein
VSVDLGVGGGTMITAPKPECAYAMYTGYVPAAIGSILQISKRGETGRIAFGIRGINNPHISSE